MTIEVQSQKAIQVSSDILVLGFFSEKAPPRGLAGEADWLLNNKLSLLLKEGKITGRPGEGILVSSDRLKTAKIYWVCLGKKEELNHSRLSALASDLYIQLARLGVKEAYLDLWDIEGCPLDFSSALNAFLKGLFQDKKKAGAPEIDLTLHTRDQDRIKELNRFLKELNLQLGGSAGGRI